MRSHRELDDLLDRLGMMLALAASAKPPSWGAGSGDPPGPTFTWQDGAALGHTVSVMLHEVISQGASVRYNLEIDPVQLARIKAFLHWLKWLNSRASRAAAFPLPCPEERPLDPTNWFVSLAVPDPPSLPLNGTMAPDHEVDWPEKPLPTISDFERWLEIGMLTALGSLPEIALAAAAAADFYFTGGTFFLVATLVYSVTPSSLDRQGQRNLTPLTYAILARSKVAIRGVPLGALLLTILTITQATANANVEIKLGMPEDARFYFTSFTVQTSRGKITVRAASVNGHTMYVSQTADGQLLGTCLLSSYGRAGAVHVGLRTQRQAGIQMKEEGLVGDLVETACSSPDACCRRCGGRRRGFPGRGSGRSSTRSRRISPRRHWPGTVRGRRSPPPRPRPRRSALGATRCGSRQVG